MVNRNNNQALELMESLQLEISQKVDEKVVQLNNHNQVNIDNKKIEEDCENRYFDELGKGFEVETDYFKSFMELLQNEDPESFKKIREFIIISHSKNPPIESWKDLQNIDQLAIPKENIAPILSRGIECFQADELEKALTFFSGLTFINPQNPEIWLLKGMALQNLNRLDQALAAYSAAIQLAPEFLYAYVQSMDCLILAGKNGVARQILDLFNTEIDSSNYANDEFLTSKINNIKDFLSDSNN